MYSYNCEIKAVLNVFSILGRSRNRQSATKEAREKRGMEERRGIIFYGISIVIKNKTHTFVLYKLKTKVNYVQLVYISMLSLTIYTYVIYFIRVFKLFIVRWLPQYLALLMYKRAYLFISSVFRSYVLPLKLEIRKDSKMGILISEISSVNIMYFSNFIGTQIIKTYDLL